MKMEKPILFSTEMVKAILKGRKTQTRRVIKGALPDHEYEFMPDGWVRIDKSTNALIKCPYGQPDDILWVRETWYYENHMYDPSEGDALHRYVYKADNPDYPVNTGVGKHGWRPSIHMPRAAARLFLRVKNVRVERLQEINAKDIIAEGTPYDREIYKMPCNIENAGETYLKGCFLRLWNNINAKRGYGWEVNPWVWVIELERLTAHK